METSENERAVSEGPGPDATPTRSSLLRIAIALIALLIVGGLVGFQLQLFDSYRPGSTHRVAVTHTCENLPDLVLDGRIWTVTAENQPNAWTGTAAGASVAGTLEVTARDQGELRLDNGSSGTYRRLSQGAFSSMRCAIK